MERVQNTPDTPEQTFCPPRPEEQAAGCPRKAGMAALRERFVPAWEHSHQD